MLFGLRYDFRNPTFAGTSMADRYSAALDMAAWADSLGCRGDIVSEHHGSDDGYLPSPVPMLAAMAARTEHVRFMVAALIAPFYDPIRLAEDMVVLDNLSRGRVDLIVAGGYVHEEFAMYDVPMADRGARVTETVSTLKAAFTGEPFDYRGRTVHVTPAPFRPGGPALILGGSSKPAAERAARIADGFMPSDAWCGPTTSTRWCDSAGPTRVRVPWATPRPWPWPRTPELGWDRMAPYFMHEMNAYGAWQAQDDIASPFRTVADLDELRSSGNYRVVTPPADDRGTERPRRSPS